VRETFEPFGLSERQLEVLRAALVGSRPREIGSQLFISELTVRNHLHAIYEKVGVSGRRELLGRFVSALLEG
jgi:DNA-binding CsgD family transcriptional regulator